MRNLQCFKSLREFKKIFTKEQKHSLTIVESEKSPGKERKYNEGRTEHLIFKKGAEIFLWKSLF